MAETLVTETAERLLRTEDVAKWLAVSKSTLVRWRQSAKGPDVYWLADGVPRYRASDVERWLSARATARPGRSSRRSGHADSAR